MDPARQKFFARAALVAFAGVCALWLGRLDYSAKISTNVLDLIPAAEQSPEIGLIRSFASDVQARVMLFALRDSQSPATPPNVAAQAFAQELIRSPVFAEAAVIGDSATQNSLGRQVMESRWELLLPSWLGQREREFARTGQSVENFPAWLAERAAADLEIFLNRPEAAAMQDLVPLDPLLLV
ncbi:MAG: hypothetical protein ABIZ49_06990, partial [Opitutaceae bacterium]